MPRPINTFVADTPALASEVNENFDEVWDSIYTGNIYTYTAGETITGATLPVPVYQNTSDNRVYICDANDSDKYKFVGFAITDANSTEDVVVRQSGVIDGFTSLAEGEPYYVQDDGTINTTPGTTEILVGLGISTTELLIQKGKRYASGVTSFTSSTTQTITVGFRASRVRIHAAQSDANWSNGGWTQQGGNDCLRALVTGGVIETAAKAWKTGNSTTEGSGIVDTITSKTFRLNEDVHGGSASEVFIFWEAEGDI